MDLDKRIAEKRGEVLARQSLDVDWNDDSVNIFKIYSAVEQEADTLNTAARGRYRAYLPSGRARLDKRTSIVGKLRRVDDRLKKIRFYRVYIREGIKKMYKKRQQIKCVNVRELLPYDDQEFVSLCYETILLREPDEEGLAANLGRLQRREISKLELAYEISNSSEGKDRGVLLKGRKIRYHVFRLFRKSRRIPVLGKVFGYLYKLCSIHKTINGLIGWNSRLENDLRNFENRIEEISERVEILEKNIRNNNILLDKHETILETEFRKDQKQLRAVIVELSNLKADFSKSHVKQEQNYESAGTLNTGQAADSVDSAGEYFSIDYFDFENRFRGSREHVKKVQQIYVPYFINRKNVVDLGCGRGEFVELLLENQIGVRGVDLYAPYTEYCKMLNLPVEQDDVIHFLKQQNCVDGIFLGQVIEHITTEQLIELCMVAYEKLEEGCYLIMETPNPKSLAIYTESFYKDPSHNRPVHPETLKYITEKQGFSEVQILYTESSKFPSEIPELSERGEGKVHEFNVAMKQVSELLYGSQDYALIAKK